MTPRLLRNTALLAAALLAAASPALAQAGKTWRTAGAAQLAEGKLDGVSILSTGEMELAPETTTLEGLQAEIIWDVEVTGPGTAYVATGTPAAVYRVTGDKVEQIHKSTEPHILSVLLMRDGSLLAATAPRGIVFRIKPGGETVVFAELDESYVWDMIPAPGGGACCATGPNGRLLELDERGNVRELAKVKQKNITCVAANKKGILYAGTEPDGFIYRVEPRGKATVLYDADENEISDLIVDPDGTVYASTAAGGLSADGDNAPMDGADGPDEGGAAFSEGTGEANSIYRIVDGRGATRVAALPGMDVFRLAGVGGRIIAGTGPGGRVFAVEPDGALRILAEFNVRHVAALDIDPDGAILIGTSNAGGLHRLGKDLRDRGAFTSRPFDATFLSNWGRIWWQQRAEDGQSVRARLRTGATAEPDEHWSDWSKWTDDPAGGPANVPMGRFAQFNLELRAKRGTPTVLEVNASYHQVNRRPKIREFVVDGRSVLRKREEDDAQTAPADNGLPPGARKLEWQAADPNEEPLVFDLHYRAAGEKEWKEIETDIEGDTEYQWETARVPDGQYLLRLTASDRNARPGPDALADVRVGIPVLVDNRRPAVEDLAARRQPDGSYEITGVARDAFSAIRGVTISRNAGKWKPAFAADGILDAAEERFAFRTEVLPPGEHVFAVAATDAMGNAGSGKIVITVPPRED